jgi:hypothetical protein
MLFAEIVSPDELRVLEVSVAGTGGIASFVRRVSAGVKRFRRFLLRHGGGPRRHNYAGEWHSHPHFALVPSGVDCNSMCEILDELPQASFVLLLLVRSKLSNLETRGFVFKRGDSGPREIIVEFEPDHARPSAASDLGMASLR